jgi:sugar phosphate isomerase/epimerase
MDSNTIETARWAAGERSVAYHVHLPLHRRLAVNQLTTLHWSLSQALEGFRQGGVPAIGLSLRRMQERGLERAIDEVQQSGLLVSTVGWVGGFTGGPCGSWEQAVNSGRLALWTASRVGAAAVVVVTGPRRSHTRKHCRRIVVDALQELAPVAARAGVKLSLQPMHPVCHRGWSFLHRLDETLSVLDDVRHPWVGLAYSPFHLSHEADLLDRVPRMIDRIASVHLSDTLGTPRNDNDRALPGDGSLALAEHIAALEGAGFRGLYEVDPWGCDLWKRNPHGLIADCRRRFEQLCSSRPLGTLPPRSATPAADPAVDAGLWELSVV